MNNELKGFVSVNFATPKQNQTVIAYKQTIVTGQPIMTPQNCVATIYCNGHYLCDFKPTHWAEVPEIQIEEL